MEDDRYNYIRVTADMLEDPEEPGLNALAAGARRLEIDLFLSGKPVFRMECKPEYRDTYEVTFIPQRKTSESPRGNFVDPPELFYKGAPHMASLVFAPPEIASNISEIHAALRSETWGEYVSLLPSAELDDVIEKFLDNDPDFEVPPDEEPFCPEDIGGFSDGDYPDWLQKDQDLWLPQSVLDRWGKRESSVFNGPFWVIDPKGEDEIVAELRRLGFRVTRRDDLNFY